MKVFNGESKFCYIKFGLVLWEGDLPCEVETEISSWAVVKGEVEVVRGLKGKVEVDDELMVGLFKDIRLDDGIFELFLKNKVLLFEGFEGI